MAIQHKLYYELWIYKTIESLIDAINFDIVIIIVKDYDPIIIEEWSLRRNLIKFRSHSNGSFTIKINDI